MSRGGVRTISGEVARGSFHGLGGNPVPEVAAMVQKIIDVVGVSTRSFADAAKNAVAVAAKTVRGMRWARANPGHARNPKRDAARASKY